nr:ribonuclease H-like domain-containing protein [Tanacetum cinerariifolium]
MRPFGYPLTILNILDSLGKFKGKVDEGFLVGYSVSGNQTNSSTGFQDKFDAEQTGEEIDQQYVLFLVWSFGSINPQNNDGDAAFDGKEPDFDAKKPESKVNVSSSSKFEDCFDNNINELNAAGDVNIMCLWLRDIKLLLVTFYAQLKIFNSLLDDNPLSIHRIRSRSSLWFLETIMLWISLNISTNSTSEVPTAYGVSIASTQSSTASTKVSTANLSDAIVDSEISRLKCELEKLKKEKESTQLKLENFNHASKSLDKLIRSQITDKSGKGVRFKSYNVVLPPPTGLFLPSKIDLSYSSLEEFKQPKFKSYGPKSCKIESKNASENIPNELKEYPDAPFVKDRVSDNKDCLVESTVVVEKKTIIPTIVKVKVVRPK